MCRWSLNSATAPDPSATLHRARGLDAASRSTTVDFNDTIMSDAETRWGQPNSQRKRSGSEIRATGLATSQDRQSVDESLTFGYFTLLWNNLTLFR